MNSKKELSYLCIRSWHKPKLKFEKRSPTIHPTNVRPDSLEKKQIILQGQCTIHAFWFFKLKRYLKACFNSQTCLPLSPFQGTHNSSNRVAYSSTLGSHVLQHLFWKWQWIPIIHNVRSYELHFPKTNIVQLLMRWKRSKSKIRTTFFLKVITQYHESTYLLNLNKTLLESSPFTFS